MRYERGNPERRAPQPFRCRSVGIVGSMRRFALALVIVCAVSAEQLRAPTAAGAEYTPITVALSGRPSPIAAQNFGTTFSPPTINTAGSVAFLGTLATAPAGTREILVEGGPGTLSLVARQDSPAAGTVGDVRYARFDAAWPISISDSGAVAFPAELHGLDARGATDHGIWTGTPGNLQRHARFGDVAAGAAVTTSYLQLRSPRLSAGGYVAFSSLVQGPGINATNDEGVWSGFPGVLGLAIEDGQNAAGFPGLQYESIGVGVGVVPQVNPGGIIAARMGLTGPGVDATNRIAIWTGPTNMLNPVARTGSQAGGAPLGQTYTALSDPAIDAFGRVLFKGAVSAPGGGSHGAIWQSSINGAAPVVMVAREGDQTGVLPGVTFSSFESPVAAGNGAVAFRSRLSGLGVTVANNEAIWFGPAGQLQMAARKSAGAPGLPQGVTFRSLDDPVINNNGVGVFTAEHAADDLGRPQPACRNRKRSERLGPACVSRILLRQQRRGLYSQSPRARIRGIGDLRRRLVANARVCPTQRPVIRRSSSAAAGSLVRRRKDFATSAHDRPPVKLFLTSLVFRRGIPRTSSASPRRGRSRVAPRRTARPAAPRRRSRCFRPRGSATRIRACPG